VGPYIIKLPESKRKEKPDPDFLLGQCVESALKGLNDPKLRLSFRKRFRDLIHECEEIQIDNAPDEVSLLNTEKFDGKTAIEKTETMVYQEWPSM